MVISPMKKKPCASSQNKPFGPKLPKCRWMPIQKVYKLNSKQSMHPKAYIARMSIAEMQHTQRKEIVWS